MEVKAWEEHIAIPTYRIGEPDKNPMFLENRVYQGSSGVVYPYPVIDKVYDEKGDKEYIALFLENEYLKVMVLPELGGRIQMAYDKTNDYHFVYYNRVIKPALVALAGPWISGGIEFNWPQHHRPSTFEPTDFLIKENDDGSKTVWVNEYERMFGTKCALGFTLYPGKAYIEVHGQLYNPTPFPQTFLWWANPAVAVDEHYQSIFPPDVHAVFDHGKRDVISFPIAKGTYYKVDYSPGTDISYYNNIPVPTSYMAVNSEFDFVGGYDHKKKAGIMHVANHHVSPGKKQWTWGSGDFGKAWDKHLTDEDGPYFELMCGVFSDNQPDFSWLSPNETKEFVQYFMPYKNIGYVKNAGIDALLNVERTDDKIEIKVYVTSQLKVTVRFAFNGDQLLNETLHLSPSVTFEKTIYIQTGDAGEYYAEVLDESGNILIEYKSSSGSEDSIPDPAKPIGPPEEIDSIENLYLAGLHLEQYRHATYSPLDYYNEALRRDATDIRCNNAIGLWYLRRGQFQTAGPYFRKAVEKLKFHNSNPYNGEPLFNLGLCLKYQKQYKEAYGHLYKSTWNAAMQDNAYLHMGYISAINSNWEDAMKFSQQSIYKNRNSLLARHLYALSLRVSGNPERAIEFNKETLLIDSFDFAAMFEMYKCYLNTGGDANKVIRQIKDMIRDRSHTYIEIAIQYANAGQYADAANFLSFFTDNATDPLTFYFSAFYEYASGNSDDALILLQKGFNCSPDRVFPNRIGDIEVLDFVISHNPQDYKALYYLGNYFYAKRLYQKAADCWQRSVNINPGFATTLRNLGVAYYNKFDRKEEALDLFERAFESDPSDSRVLFELDQLRKRLNKSPEARLQFLSQHEDLVKDRDDLYIEYVTLHSLSGKLEAASALLQSRNFHPWEGGEGKSSGQHVLINVELAKQALQNGNVVEAADLLRIARIYPENIGEGKIYGTQENDIFYWLGCVYEKTGEVQKAISCWEKSAVGLSDPAPAIFYNDQQPDKILYQGLSLLKLGRIHEARQRFQSLIQYGQSHIEDKVKMDYFAVSLPDLMIFNDDLSVRNKIHCLYLLGLGNLGLRKNDVAKKYFEKVLAMNRAHSGAVVHSRLLEKGLYTFIQSKTISLSGH